MAVAVESFDFIPVRGAEVFEMFMFEGMVHVIAPVMGLVVAIPMIVAHVRQLSLSKSVSSRAGLNDCYPCDAIKGLLGYMNHAETWAGSVTRKEAKRFPKLAPPEHPGLLFSSRTVNYAKEP